MSRTNKGSKPLGYDYWSKRPGSGWGYGKHIKDITHSRERMCSKHIVKDEVDIMFCDFINNNHDHKKYLKNRIYHVALLAA